jgi:membrane protein implicated in regulation of membrane protease activity
MRLSRSRLLLRALLLASGSAFMFWRAWHARRAAPAVGGPGALTGSNLALGYAVMGVLALLAAVTAALALRARPPRRASRPGDPPERERRGTNRDVEARPGRGANQ